MTDNFVNVIDDKKGRILSKEEKETRKTFSVPSTLDNVMSSVQIIHCFNFLTFPGYNLYEIFITILQNTIK